MKKNYFLILTVLAFTLSGFSQNPKEDWVTYVAEKEKGIMTISSNLYYNFMGKPNYKNLLIVGTSTKNCLKNGYPDYLGLAKFYSFSDSIANHLEKLTKSRLVGVLTYQCSGFDVYYVKDTTHIRKDLQHFLDYNHALSKNYLTIQYDKKWKYYKDNLIPQDLSDTFFANHNFLNQLITEGDQPSIPRKVEHWINFKRENNRTKFLDKIKTYGFAIDSLKYSKSYFPYQAKISRKDSISPSTIQVLTTDLSRLALMYNGIYDGWGTEPARED